MTIERTTTYAGIVSTTKAVEPGNTIIPLTYYNFEFLDGPEKAITVTSPDSILLHHYRFEGYSGEPDMTEQLEKEEINTARLVSGSRFTSRQVYKWSPDAPKSGTIYHLCGVKIPVFDRKKK